MINAEQWGRVREVFDALVELDETDRAVQLSACTSLDEQLREEVARLLRSAPSEHTLANAPEMAAGLHALDGVSEPSAPQNIGAWRVLEALGEGGMGSVYLGERLSDGVRQLAALKLLKGHSPSQQGLARFRSEQRMLAELHHPNIAHLIESGIDSRGVPYIAMEYVDGRSLMDYADHFELDAAKRLALFRQICAAVDHAHQRLIVHRDLKPNNILVNAQGQTKLLDFGIGKLLSDLDGATQLTQTGMRLFTLGYAAPEQLSGEVVSTATDVFSLGVILYELLTRRLPFAVESHRVVDWERRVMSTQPTPPSACARTTQRTERDPLGSVPMARSWSNDIDAIVLKALRPEQAQRYSSVAQLSADLLALLEGRPVSARRGTRRYRAGKFLRRHALAVALTGIAVTGVLGGAAAALWQAREAQSQRDQARAESLRANAVVDFMTEVFADADPGKNLNGAMTAREVLDKGRDQIPQRVDLDPATRASLGTAIARAYRALGASAEVLAMMKTALTLARESDNPRVLLDALIQMAVGQMNTDQELASLTTLDEARALLRSASLDLPLKAAQIDYLAATALVNLDRSAEGLPRMQAAYEVMLRLQGPLAEATLAAQPVYASILSDLGRGAEAHLITGPSIQAMQVTDLSPILKSSLLNGHGLAMLFKPDFVAAELAFRQALAIDEALYGPTNINTRSALNNLSVALGRQRKYEEALGLAERALAIVEVGALPRMTARHFNVARFALKAKRFGRARELIDAARLHYQAQGQPIDARELDFQLLNAELLLAEGKPAQARSTLAQIQPHLQNPAIASATQHAQLAELSALLAARP